MEIWKRNLFVCWFGAFITAIGLSQIAPFLPVYIKDLGVQNAHNVDILSGICFGITFLISAIVSPMWAKMSDKGKYRNGNCNIFDGIFPKCI